MLRRQDAVVNEKILRGMKKSIVLLDFFSRKLRQPYVKKENPKKRRASKKIFFGLPFDKLRTRPSTGSGHALHFGS